MAAVANNIIIQPADENDMVDIAHMSLQALIYSNQQMGLDDDINHDQYIEKIINDGVGGLNLYGAIIAKQNDKPVGFIQYGQGYDIKYPGVIASLNEIFVIEDLRRQKIGIRLMITMAKFASHFDWQEIRWNVNRLDIDARVFFDILMPESFKLNNLTYEITGKEIISLAALA